MLVITKESSFRGLRLRIMLWIALLCKTVGKQFEAKAMYVHPNLRYKMLESTTTLLNYMKDVVDELEDKRVTKASSYDWKKHIRISWSAEEQTCKVDIGSFSVPQKNEYLGNAKRFCSLYPISEKLFVNISSSLREKSGVVARCHAGFDVGSEVFQEFAYLCSMPLQRLVCHPGVTLKQSLQYVNAAALAGVWLLFESLEQLPLLTLVTLSKEIQMVQQQFIIADLVPSQEEENAANESKESNGQNVAVIEHSQSSLQIKRKPPHPSKGTPRMKEELPVAAGEAEQISAVESATGEYQSKQKLRLSTKACFGIFATALNDSLSRIPAGEGVLEGLKGAFRISTVVCAEPEAYLPFELKAKRFRNYRKLSQSILLFYEKLGKLAAGRKPDFRLLQTLVDVAERIRDLAAESGRKDSPDELQKLRIANISPNIDALYGLEGPASESPANILKLERTAVSEAVFMYERGKIPEKVTGEEWELMLLKTLKDSGIECADSQAARQRLETLQGIRAGHKGKYELAVLAKESAEGLKMVANEWITNKVVELYQVTLSRQHVCLSGGVGCGKSSLIAIFCSFLYRLQGQIVKKHLINLAVESAMSLYGGARKEECILKGIEQDFKEQSGCIPCVICDSDLDSVWLEIFARDKHVLPESTLKFPARTLFFYETLSLSNVSPRTASQIAIVNVEADTIPPRSILSSGITMLYEECAELFINAFVEKDGLGMIVMPIFDPLLEWAKGAETARWKVQSCISASLKLLRAYLVALYESVKSSAAANGERRGNYLVLSLKVSKAFLIYNSDSLSLIQWWPLSGGLDRPSPAGRTRRILRCW